LEGYVGASEDEIPENIVIEQERISELYSKISSALSRQEWQVFQLFLTGMSYNQIALKSGLSVKTVDNAMQRVRRKLKALLR
jgi:RNA polymerase sporulation-specific sigma factor